MNDWREMLAELPVDNFRLPNEFEWEYASRGGQPLNPYPWGGPYLRNGKGCILANFKPGRGNYPDDGGFYTVKVNSYWPNDFGLYNMAGNVAEWTADAFEENAVSFQHDLNGTYTYNATSEDINTLKKYEGFAEAFIKQLKNTFAFKENQYACVFVYNYEGEASSKEIKV